MVQIMFWLLLIVTLSLIIGYIGGYYAGRAIEKNRIEQILDRYYTDHKTTSEEDY